MALNRVPCPECGAGLKSPSGFELGQRVCCPKCETYFLVEESAEEDANTPRKAQAAGAKKPVKAAAVVDDEEVELPKKKKKKTSEDDETEKSYKNSPMRYAILGVLVCVMVGLGVMLYLKKTRENDTSEPPPSERPPQVIPPPPGEPIGVGIPKGGGGRPIGNPNPKKNIPAPKTNPGGGFAIPFMDGGASLSPADAAAKLKQYEQRIVASWKADLDKDKKNTAELIYSADGTFTDTLTIGGTPKTITGRWTADRLIAGNKGMLITRTVAGERTTVRAEFEGDELLHDTQDRGTIGTFRQSGSRK